MHNELSFIWAAAPFGMAKVAKDGRFQCVNARFCEITCYSETELYKRTFQDITHPDDLAADVAEADNLSKNKELEHYQMVKRYIRKDGHTAWVNIFVYAIRNEAYEFQYFFVFVAELSPIICTGNYKTNYPERQANSKSIFDYARSNPKEAIVLMLILIAIIQGRNLFDIFLMLLKQ